MIEHPVPQNVTAYQFRLVGDMTLKQFLELAGGIFAAWLIWTFDIPSFIKWPFVILAALAGFALAFLPLEDRPLDQWVISFFRAVYQPTLFWWKKVAREDIFQFVPKPTEKKPALDAAVKAPAARLQTLLQAYQLQAMEQTALDPLEKDWLDREQTIPGLFEEVQVPKKLTLETTFPRPMELPPQKPTTRVFLHPLRPPLDPQAIIRGEIVIPLRQPKIPAIRPVETLETISLLREVVAPTPVSSHQRVPAPVLGSIPSLPVVHQQSSPGSMTTTLLTAAMPSAPDQPNILSGMVVTPEGLIVENAIIEIRDSSGLPVRALKTNKLGQFSIATPLRSGTYTLLVEKEGLRFDILKLDAVGSVMQPIEIKAKQ